MPIAYLGVIGVLDLQPGRGAAIRVIRAAGPLADDAFQIAIASDAKQIASALRNMIEVEHAAFNLRHDPQQFAFAVEQRERSNVATVDAQQIERVEVRPLSAEQQIIEIAAAVRAETADLAVKDRVVRTDPCAISSASCGQDLNIDPLRETSWHHADSLGIALLRGRVPRGSRP